MTKQKALCVATRCTTAQQFIETFHRYCDEQSFFVATMNLRPVGLETPFSIQLADKTPVLQGLCVVLAAYATASNPFRRPGIRLGIRRLTPDSEAVFYQLQAMRTATPQEIATEASEALTETPVPVPPPIPPPPRVAPPPPKQPTPRAGSTITVPPKIEAKPTEERTPGSELVLPANPLSGLDDSSLGGFIDCTLYEETANFFRADDDGGELDEVAPPPKPAVDAPVFKPAVASVFGDELTGEPTRERRPSVSPITAAPTGELLPRTARVTGELAPLAARSTAELLPLPAPSEGSATIESSVVASLARVETSVARLLDVVDTSRPIDDGARVTPLPAGEAYARQVEKRAAQRRSKWLVIGGATIAASLAVVLVVVTRSKADDAKPAPAPAPSPPIAMRERPADPKPVERPVRPADPPIADAPKPEPAADGEELAAVTGRTPETPAVGDGPCTLEVKTTPAGTMVKLDGDTIGPSPLTISGPCTRRRIDLVHPRYKAEQRWVTLAADQPGTLDVTLVRPTHTLMVTSNPPGATVYIAGRRAGTTPTKVPLMGFSGLEVKVEKRGFETVTKRIYSKVAQDRMTVTLRRSLFLK